MLPGAYSAAFASLSGAARRRQGSWAEVTESSRTTPTTRATAIRSRRTPSGGAGPGLGPHRRPRARRRRDLHRRRERRRVPIRRQRSDLDAVDRRPADAVGRRSARGARRRALAGDRRSQHRRDGVRRLRRLSSGRPRRAASFSVADRVGGTELESTFIGKLRFDGAGNVYAATSRGLWKHSATTAAGAWRRVLYPVPDPVVDGVPRPDLQSPYANICNDVAIEPGSGGQRVLVNCAWRDGAAYNGFYYSTRRRADVRARQSERRAQSAGRRPHHVRVCRRRRTLYALVESMTHYTNSNQTALGGVFVSPSGSPAGPWNKIADRRQARLEGIRAQECRRLPARHPGLVQPVPRRRSRRSAITSSSGSRRSTRPRTAASHWTRSARTGTSISAAGRSIRRAQHLPDDDAPGPAFDRDRQRMRLRRQRRRPLSPAAARHGQRATATRPTGQNLNANIRTLQYYSVAVGKVAGRRRGVRRPAGQRRLAAACPKI